MLLVRPQSQLFLSYNLAFGEDTCHSLWKITWRKEQAMQVKEGKGRGEPERGGTGKVILKENEELLKHESKGKGREAQHGGVGGRGSRATETVAKKRMTGIYCEM